MQSRYKMEYKTRVHKFTWQLAVVIFVTLFFSTTGCKKQVEVNPPFTAVNFSNVFNSDANAISEVTSMYADLAAGGIFSFASGLNSISLRAGLSADEIQGTSTSLGTTLVRFYRNALTNNNNLTFWENFYRYIYRINSSIENLETATSLTFQVRKQLIGECKFLRAFIYFYLVNFYGDVPITTTGDYKINSILSRTSSLDVYSQILSDLKNAKDSLSEDYLDATLSYSSSERVRPNKWAAAAFLSRVYLYKADYKNAEFEASNVINNKTLYDTVSLNNVFLKNSKEAIWQLQPVNANENTKDGVIFILTSAPNSFATPVYLTNYLLNSFEAGDNRKTSWVNSIKSGVTTYNYPYKYKVKTASALTEHLMVLRLAEQYLIRSEARAQLDKILEAQSDLNIIRKRARLGNTTLTDKASLLSAILHERQVELFTEWGHRWLDLKRTNTIDAVMSVITPLKGGTWNTNWQWYPLPLYDLQTNPNLIQTSGY